MYVATARIDKRDIIISDQTKNLTHWWDLDSTNIEELVDGIPKSLKQINIMELLPITPPNGRLGTWMVVEMLTSKNIVFLDSVQQQLLSMCLATIGKTLISALETNPIVAKVDGVDIIHNPFKPPLRNLEEDNLWRLSVAIWLTLACVVTDYSYWSGRRCFRDLCTLSHISRHIERIEKLLVDGHGLLIGEKQHDFRSTRIQDIAAFQEIWKGKIGDEMLDKDFALLECNVLFHCGVGRRGSNKLPRNWLSSSDVRTSLPEYRVEKQNYRLIISFSGRGTGYGEVISQLASDLSNVERPESARSNIQKMGIDVEKDVLATINKLYYVMPEMYRFNLISRYNAWFNADRATIKVELGSERRYDTNLGLEMKTEIIHSERLKDEAASLQTVASGAENILRMSLAISSLLQTESRWWKEDYWKTFILKREMSYLDAHLWHPFCQRPDSDGFMIMFLACETLYNKASQRLFDKHTFSKTYSSWYSCIGRSFSNLLKKFKWHRAKVRVLGERVEVSNYISASLMLSIIFFLFVSVIYVTTASVRKVEGEQVIQTLLAILALSLPIVYKVGELALDPKTEESFSFLGLRLVSSDISELVVDSNGAISRLVFEEGIHIGGQSCALDPKGKKLEFSALKMSRGLSVKEVFDLGLKFCELSGLICLVDMNKDRIARLALVENSHLVHCLGWNDMDSNVRKSIKMVKPVGRVTVGCSWGDRSSS